MRRAAWTDRVEAAPGVSPHSPLGGRPQAIPGSTVGGMPRPVTTAIPMVGVTLALAFPAFAKADTFAVNDRGDHFPGPCTDGDCTLREAVMDAEANAGDDRVKLPSQKPKLTRDHDQGFLDPENGVFDVEGGAGGTDAMTIFHPGAGKAIVDAQSAKDRAFLVVAPSHPAQAGTARGKGEVGRLVGRSDLRRR